MEENKDDKRIQKKVFEKLKNHETRTVSKLLCGLCLKEGEKGKLYEICIKYGIPINYPSLFEDYKHYYLWGISTEVIELVGTIIMDYLSQSNEIIFHSLDELEEYLKKSNDN